MKQFKKFAALLLTAALVLSLFPAVTFAREAEQMEPIEAAPNYGLINQYHVGSQAVSDAYRRGDTLEVNGVDLTEPVRDLPSSWDSRNNNWITPVKDQNPYGSCWAHAAMACVESYMIKEGVPVGTGAAATTSLNLSETQHCYFNYSTAYDAEGMTNGDKCTLTGGDSCLDSGGNGEMSAYTLQHWTGSASESAASALQYSNASSVASSGLNSQYCYQYNVSHVQNSEWIPGDNITAIKEAIMKYGAGNISYYAGNSYTTYTYTYQCTIDTTSQDSSSHKWANHAITVIGWDDSIASSRFSPNKPSGSGAWLCKNSWGTGYFNSGYMWISYEDTSVREGYIYFYDAEPIDNYQHNYQYDGSCNVVTYGIGNRVGFANNTKVANVFTAKGNEVLKAVALCNWDEALTYTVEIYKNPTSTPDSGTLMSTQTGTLTFSGYYTIPLDTPVSLAAGDKFAVVINQYVPVADDSGKYVHTPYDATFNDSSVVSWANWTHVNHGNTSYYKEPNGTWTDCPDNGDYRIKAYTDDVTFTLTAVPNNASYGTVSVSGSTINCTPANGYYVESCTVLSGTATCTINGNTVTVAAEADCTVQVNFAPKPSYTINFVACGNAEGSQTALVQDEITLPATVSATAEGWTFVGWMNQQIDETTEKPTYYAPGASYTVTGNATLYAVYTRVEEGTGEVIYQKADSVEDDAEYILVDSNSVSGSSGYAVGNAIVTSNHYLNAVSVTVNSSDNTVTATAANLPKIIWKADAVSNGYTFYNENVGKYLGLDSSEYLYPSATALAWAYTAEGYMDNQSDSEGYYYLSFDTTNIRYTTNKAGKVINLYKAINDSTTYYWTDPIVAEHDHELSLVPAAEPTCVLDGNVAYYQCSICGKYFSDAEGENEINLADTVIAALGHDYVAVVTPPTEEEQGYTTHTCSRCGDSYVDSYVDPLGYDYTVTFTVPDGVTAPAAMTINSVSGAELPVAEAPEGYEFLGWVTEDYDNVTEQPETILTGLYKPTGDVTLKAMYTYELENGVESGYYLVTSPSSVAAGDQLIITANGSNNASLSTTQNNNNRGYVNGEKSADYSRFEPAGTTAILTVGTGTATGSISLYDPANNGYLCAASNSGNYLRTNSTLNANGSWVITMSGNEATLTAQGNYSRKVLRYNSTSRIFACYSTNNTQQTVFLYRYEERPLSTPYYTTIIAEPAHEHTVAHFEGQPATCTEEGVRDYYYCADASCELYGKMFADAELSQELSAEDVVLPALGHDFQVDEVVPATCTEEGYTVYKCSRCDAEEMDDIVAALGHEYAAVVTEPTCTEPGFTTYTCTRCDDSYVDDETEALGHQPGEPVEENRVEPTVTEPGGYDTVVYCRRCGQELSRVHTEIPVLGPQEPILDTSLKLFYSVSTEIEIVTQYSVIKSDVQSYASWYVEISKLDADGNPTETKRFGEGQEGAVEEVGAYVWSVNYVDVTAKEMGVPYRATLHAFEANGQEHYSESVTKTVREVLLEVVQDDRSTDERRTLAADMLNYGAAAQAYFGFDVEHPVNANLSTAEQEDVDYYASTGEAPANLNNTGSVNVFCSTSIMNRIVLHVSLLGPTGENVKVRMKELNGDAVIDLDAENQGRVYEASYSGLTARNMRTAYEVGALVDGAAWGTPAIWSVEGHIKAARENPKTSQEELALMNALLHYVDSVAAAQ